MINQRKQGKIDTRWQYTKQPNPALERLLRLLLHPKDDGITQVSGGKESG